MKLFKPASFGLILVVAACGAAPDRYAVTPPSVIEKVRIGHRSVEVRKVSLPTYAAADEIAIQDTDGKLSTNAGMLWADSPERAIALDLSRDLAQMTGARVASEPWPFVAPPDAQLEIRFESLIAGSDGQFRASGQYFVAVEDGGRERSGLFELAVPFDPSGGPKDVASARGRLILDLATLVARKGLR